MVGSLSSVDDYVSVNSFLKFVDDNFLHSDLELGFFGDFFSAKRNYLVYSLNELSRRGFLKYDDVDFKDMNELELSRVVLDFYNKSLEPVKVFKNKIYDSLKESDLVKSLNLVYNEFLFLEIFPPVSSSTELLPTTYDLIKQELSSIDDKLDGVFNDVNLKYFNDNYNFLSSFLEENYSRVFASYVESFFIEKGVYGKRKTDESLIKTLVRRAEYLVGK